VKKKKDNGNYPDPPMPDVKTVKTSEEDFENSSPGGQEEGPRHQNNGHGAVKEPESIGSLLEREKPPTCSRRSEDHKRAEEKQA